MLVDDDFQTFIAKGQLGKAVEAGGLGVSKGQSTLALRALRWQFHVIEADSAYALCILLENFFCHGQSLVHFWTWNELFGDKVNKPLCRAVLICLHVGDQSKNSKSLLQLWSQKSKDRLLTLIQIL